MSDVVEVFEPGEAVVQITEGAGVVDVLFGDVAGALIVTEPATQILEVITPGPQGPRGDVGAQGAQGVPGPSETFEQTFADAQATWTIAHSLTGQPEVTTVDLGGMEMIGDVYFPAPGLVVIEFAVPVAGVARLKG